MIKIKKSDTKAWITFVYPHREDLRTVKIVGSWNKWKGDNLKKRKNGDFSTTKILPLGQIYEFRYFVNDKNWENDEDAMEIANSFGSVNSAIKL